MTALSPEERAHFEALLNEYEKMREDAQDGLKTVVGELREKLAPLVAKGDLADEIAGFRLYVRRRFLAEHHPEKVAKADAKSEIADAYEFQASQDQVYTTRTRSAGRASQTPHDADTGEVIDDAALRVVSLASGLSKLAADGNTDALAVMAAAKAGPDVMRATAAAILERDEQNPEPGAGDEGMGNGERAIHAETMLEPNLGNAAGRTAEDDVETSAAGASPVPITEIADELEASVSKPAPVELSEAAKASRAKAIAAGYVISDEPFEPVGVSIPNFRANTDQVGRA